MSKDYYPFFSLFNIRKKVKVLIVEDETAAEILDNNIGSLSEYEVYDKKKRFKYVRVIKRIQISDDLPF